MGIFSKKREILDILYKKGTFDHFLVFYEISYSSSHKRFPKKSIFSKKFLEGVITVVTVLFAPKMEIMHIGVPKSLNRLIESLVILVLYSFLHFSKATENNKNAVI